MKKVVTGLCILLAGAFAARAQNYHITFRSKLIFPDQTLANVWGYAANGKEYALVGASKGLAIVDVTDPDNPVLLTQLTDTINSLWREVKTFGSYAYVTSEGLTPSGAGGLGIANLSNLPTLPVPFHKYHGDGPIANKLKRAHALHIDTLKGFAYIYGTTNLASGGAVALDLNADPYNPTYAGQYNAAYVHDGYAHNDTVYAAEIYQGRFSIINFTNKAAPVVLATQTTPNAFTHNTWLNANGNYLFTTDEKSNGTLAAYDIDDPTNIIFKDQIHCTPGSGSIVHNTHIKDHYAITSWYTDGVTIVDVSRPENLVQVGRYDTWPGSGSGFKGAWGVYPYLPSGNLLVSNIDEYTSSGPDTGALYILTPTYVPACYLEGTVTDASSGSPLSGVTVEIQHSDPLNEDVTNSSGQYKTGQPTAGTFNVVFSKSGYVTQTLQATLSPGNVTVLDVSLQQQGLPLELLSFEAHADGPSNLITWTTARELNTAAHVLEFRSDFREKWKPLATIPAAGFSESIRHYSFLHEAPPSLCMYRLRTEDFDGTFQLSEVVVVERPPEGVKLKSIRMVTADEMIVRLESADDGAVQLELIDAMGRQVFSERLAVLAGERDYHLLVRSTFSEGWYALRMHEGARWQVLPLIIKGF
ncbi:MAG: hypothetical protein KatS3mg030_454 [Saprospiraceae bacterium]|nr:MAG: hypothetical protein KatS3mg030_454 [Saprospiraceae bacterium]